MNFAVIGLVIALALVLGAVLDGIAKRWHLPFNLMLLLSGFLVSEVIVMSGHDTGLRWYHFHDVASGLLIPLLITVAVTTLQVESFAREWRAMLISSGPALVVSVFVTAAVLYIGIGHPQGFPLTIALAAAALFVAIDPAEIIEQSARDPVLTRPNQVLEGESVLSDVIAVTLFGVFMEDMLMSPSDVDFTVVGSQLVWSAAGGLALGLIMGYGGRLLGNALAPGVARTMAYAAIVFSAFQMCQYVVQGSGAVAALVTGLTMAPASGGRPGNERVVLEAIGWSARVLIFLLAGATVTVFMFRDQWLAMMIAIAAVSCARILSIEGLFRAVQGPLGIYALDWKQRRHVVLGGTRGAIVLALALSLPLEFDNWYTLQSMVYGLVLFTLAVHPIAALWSAKRQH